MDMLPITASTSDELFSRINIDDFERPWTSEIGGGFIDFCHCLNCEKLTGGWTFRRSEPDQNCDVNRMCIVYNWPPGHNLTECYGGLRKQLGVQPAQPLPSNTNTDFFAIFGCSAHFMNGWKWLEIDWQFANRNCHRLSRVSWALAQISCYFYWGQV